MDTSGLATDMFNLKGDRAFYSLDNVSPRSVQAPDILSSCLDMGSSGLAAAMLNLKDKPMLYRVVKMFTEVFSPKTPQSGVLILQISCQVAEVWALPF